MAKKKKKAAAKKRGEKRQSRESAVQEPERVSREALESIAKNLIFGRPAGGLSPLDRAQELMYDALELPPRQQVAAAKQALEISLDCADAYCVLAYHASSLGEALDLYEQAVAAGERAIGKRSFEEYRGHFWGFIETRPYMRAVQDLADCLWDAGRCGEAIEHYQRMLDLNPNDNQGIRYMLVAALLDEERNDEAARLLEQYEDDTSAEWVYSAALLAFRQEGNSARADRLLQRAIEQNKHVPDYLLGHLPVPQDLPEYVGRGDDSEAQVFAVRFLGTWKNTSGAITWLRRVSGPGREKARPRPPAWSEVKAELLKLPRREGEVWQADVRQVENSGESGERLWMVFVISRADRALLAADGRKTRPTTTEAWGYVAQAMLDPLVGKPRRPERIEVRLKTLQNGWRSKLEQIDAECDRREVLDLIDEMAEGAGAAAAFERRQSPLGDLDLSDVAELPQESDEVWQADARRLGAWVEIGGQPQRPWAVLVTNRTLDLVLGHDLRFEPPDAACLWENILQAISSPFAGPAHRPGTVEVHGPDASDFLQPRLQSIGVECATLDVLDHLDFVCQHLEGHLAGDSKKLPALVDVPRMRPGLIADFFDAAADFYRAKPWRQVPGDTPIEITSDISASGPWYAAVMGQMGMTLGLSIHEGRESLEAILGDDSPETNANRTSAISLMYGEAFEIAPEDLAAAEAASWPVAGPEAYPWAIRVNPGRAVRAPLAWELSLLTGCLRAIPQFIREVGRDQKETRTVSTGTQTLQLSWCDLDA